MTLKDIYHTSFPQFFISNKKNLKGIDTIESNCNKE